MNKRALLTIPATILATLAVAGVAEAHNATAAGTCQGGVSWNAYNYDKTVVNTITVTIDGQVRWQDLDMKASDTGTIATDKTVAHSWSVVVNAPGSQYDKSLTGQYPACVVPTTTTVAPTTTTTEPAVTTTTLPCQEDEPCWDCTTMGNQICGPTTTVAPAVRGEPICEPDMPCWPCRDYPGYVCPSDVVSLTPVEPVLPVTGGVDTVLIGACILFAAGIVLLVVRGRRVQ